LPPEPIHVFPLDPAHAGSYSPGGHAYLATDIFAPIGTAFVAVTSGVIQGVSRTDVWNPDIDDGANRGGLFVSLIGDDGVRYYGSHLSAVADGIEAGVRVEAGQLLGNVGVSGSARDTPPHLHFGISRPTALDDWETRRGEVDPVPFLDAWLAGDTAAAPLFEVASTG
jgi:murein DD-endopeptidase MepM/ murein hydrolase activator NlpD